MICPKSSSLKLHWDRRDASRLLTLDKHTGRTEHHHFYELPQFLRPGDCLVLNNSRVLPARLIGHRPTGGAVELLCWWIEAVMYGNAWSGPARSSGREPRVSFGDGQLQAEIQSVLPGGNRLVHFEYQGIFLEVLEELGRMPLPPYIKAELQDQERYQTVYSKVVGSAAAPTAGLHFTPELLERIEAMGVKLCYVTLHVGLGTFRPVKEEEITDHEMHSEYCVIPQETADIINETKRQGGEGNLRWNDLLPYAGELGGRGWRCSRNRRLDRHLYLPWIPLQSDGRPDHQFSLARVHAHYAGVGLAGREHILRPTKRLYGSATASSPLGMRC